jgi:hypothetical protein
MALSSQDKGDEVLRTSGGVEMGNSSLDDRQCQLAIEPPGSSNWCDLFDCMSPSSLTQSVKERYNTTSSIQKKSDQA